MGYAAEALKKALVYDDREKTLYLSAHIQGLADARDALLTAFAKEDALVRQVQVVRNPPTFSLQPGEEMLCLQGVSSLFGYPSRDIYLEFGLKDGNVRTMLLLIPLPTDWRLTTAFPQLDGYLPAGGRLSQPTIVISHGLSTIAGSRVIQEHDRQGGTTIDLSGYPLQDGFQIIARTLTGDGAALDPGLRSQARAAGLPEESLPPATGAPERVEIRADVHSGWLVFEQWWTAAPPEGFNAEGIHATGVATRYDLQQPAGHYAYWLQEIGTLDRPLVLEARIVEAEAGRAYPIRYSSRFATRTPLGDAARALKALMGPRSSIFDELALALPDMISLLGFTYAPGEWIQFTFAAGDYTDSEHHLVTLGPVELREVDFTVTLPIGATSGAASVALEGTAAFFGEQFRVRVRPHELIEGGLADLDGIDVGRFLGDLLPVGLPFGLESVRLSQAWVSHTLGGPQGGPTTTSLLVRLDGKVTLIPNAIELETIQLDIDYGSDGKTTHFQDARFAALFRMGPIELSTLVDYRGNGWLFSGMARADDGGISLRALVDHLAQGVGASIPDEVPDVHLESFAVAYDTADRSLDVQGVATWKIPDDIPVVAGMDNRILLQLTVVEARGEGGRHAILSIDWTVEKGGYELDAKALLGRETQHFSLDFNAPDEPLTLTALAHSLDLPAIPTPVAGGLDALFQVSSLALDYDRRQRTFSIAWSRPLPDVGGLLVAEYAQQSGATSGQSRQVEISWMAVKPDETIGIDALLHLVGAPDLFDALEAGLHEVGLDGIVAGVRALLTFRQLGFDWQESTQGNLLTITALSTFPHGAQGSTGGTRAFITLSTGQNEGLVAGVSLVEAPADPRAPEATAEQPARLPLPDFLPESVTSLLTALEDVLADVEITHLLVSTVTSNRYQPPAFSADAMQPGFARQGSAPTQPFGGSTTALGRGLSVGARVRFGEHDIVRRVIDVAELDGQLTIGEVCALQLSIPGSLSLDAGGGNNLVLTSPLLRIKENVEAGPEFDLQGGLKVHLFGQLVEASGWLALAEESVSGHIQLTDLALPTAFTPIPALQGVQLVVDQHHPLSFEVGLQFEPPGLDLGLSASFAIYRNATDLVYGDTALVLEIVEELPQPLYVEFSIEEMSIPICLEAIYGVQLRLHQADELAKLAATGAALIGSGAGQATAEEASAAIEAAQSALGHAEALLSSVELRDVRIRWADSIVNLPDGTTALPGVELRGGLRIFGWDAFAMLNISAQGTPGISGHFEADQIEIGRVLRIWGDGRGIHSPPATAEDVDRAMQGKDDPATATAQGGWFIEPGGPVLHLSTHSAPFFHADLHAELFGFLHTDIHADITEKGFDFDFKIGAGNAVTAELECHWWHDEGRFEAHGDMGIQLKGDIGPLIPHVSATAFHLDSELDAHVSLLVDSEQFRLTVNGSFEFQGASLEIPELVVTVRFSTLAALAKAVWDHVVAMAEHIFEEYLLPIGEAVADAARAVAHVAVAAAHEVAEIASAAATEARAIVSDVGGVVAQDAKAIGEAASQLASRAEDVASHAAERAMEAAAPVIQAAAALGEQAEQLAAEVAANIQAIATEVAALVSEAAHYALHVAEEAAHWVAERLDEARRWVLGRLAQARALAQQFAREAEAAVRAIEDEIGQIEDEIEHFFASLGHGVEHAASSVFHAVTPW